MKLIIILVSTLCLSSSIGFSQEVVLDTLLSKLPLYIDEDAFRYVLVLGEADNQKRSIIDLDCDSFLKKKDEIDKVLVVHPAIMHSLLLPKGIRFSAKSSEIESNQLSSKCGLKYLWLSEAEIVFVEIDKVELKNAFSHSSWVDTVFPKDGVIKIGVILE